MSEEVRNAAMINLLVAQRNAANDAVVKMGVELEVQAEQVRALSAQLSHAHEELAQIRKRIDELSPSAMESPASSSSTSTPDSPDSE